MYIPTWILVIIIIAVAFYYFRKRKIKNDIHPLIKTAMEKNNGNPTYDQMLKMNEEDFKKWLTLRNETDREKLLIEMIDHEERTGSFRKTAKKISGSEQAILDVFDIDLVEHAIFAKAASDHVGLGRTREDDASG